MTITYVLLGVLVLIALWAIGSYNHFVTLLQRCKEAWADIDVQLKRRYDLIPNLVEAVKGYAAHEKEAFENVTTARAAAMDAGGMAQKAKAEDALGASLGRLIAIAEAYPDLKANQNFLELQRELSDTENKIQSARRFYNGNVRDLNTSLQTFPGSVVANFFHFEPRDFFEIADANAAEREPVAVKF